MTDDIVTRLGTADDCIRELLSGCICDFIGDGNCRCCRAAEMIERLRADRDRLATTVEELLLSNNRWQSIAERAMEQLDIAMNLINTLQGVNNG